MIVYICEGCLARHMFTCEFCHGHKFLEECLDTESIETATILAQLRARNFGSGSQDPIGGENVRETSNSPEQREQMAESTGEDSNSSHEDSAVGECRKNEEGKKSNLCTRPNQQQQLDSTDIECHWNEDSYASNVRNQQIVLEGRLLDQVSKNENALNTSSPDIQNVWNKTQTCRPTVIVCHSSEDTKVSNFRNQHIPLDQEQLAGHFGQNRTAINTPSPKIQNTCCETRTSLAQDNAVEISSNVNYGEDSTSSFGANPQRLMNFPDQSSDTNQNKGFSIERILGKQTTAESSRTESRDGQIVFSSTSSCRFRLPQSVPGNFIIDHDAREARNRATHFPAELFVKRGNPFHLQQGGHSSKKLARMESDGNYPVVHAPLADCSPSTTANPRFKCEKCTRKFKNENSFIYHIEAHEKGLTLFKCDECPEEFRYESRLRRHYERTHKKVWPCHLCDHEPEGKQELLRHVRDDHSSLLSGQELKCDNCIWEFIDKSRDGTRVRGGNDDPNALKCYLCSGEFNCKHELYLHYKMAHGRRFECNECGYATTRKQNLTLHRNTMHKK